MFFFIFFFLFVLFNFNVNDNMQCEEWTVSGLNATYNDPAVESCGMYGMVCNVTTMNLTRRDFLLSAFGLLGNNVNIVFGYTRGGSVELNVGARALFFCDYSLQMSDFATGIGPLVSYAFWMCLVIITYINCKSTPELSFLCRAACFWCAMIDITLFVFLILYVAFSTIFSSFMIKSSSIADSQFASLEGGMLIGLLSGMFMFLTPFVVQCIIKTNRKSEIKNQEYTLLA